MIAVGMPAFGFLEEFSKSPADKSVDDAAMLEARVAAALEEGYQRGFAAGRAEGMSQADVTVRELRETFTSEKAVIQDKWQQDIGTRVATIVEVGMATIREQLEQHVADLLQPWLLDKMHSKALQEFLAALDRIIVDGVSVEIKGPRPIVDTVAVRLGQKANVSITNCEDDASVVVKAEGTVITANFDAWMAKIREMTHE